jgi:ElaB/YqjD/DUF883 family membrane-anchored ribosome-binding protein
MAASPSNEKLTEALKLLDEAAKLKKSELSELLEGRYSHLKETFQEKEKEVSDRVHRAVDAGREKADEWTQQIESEIREKPLRCLAVAAGVAFLLGMHVGRK